MKISRWRKVRAVNPKMSKSQCKDFVYPYRFMSSRRKRKHGRQ